MKIILFFALLISSSALTAQELNCQVSVLTNPALEVNTTQKDILKEIEQAIFDLLNETAWTKERFEVEERINCNFQLSIIEIKGDNYRATMQIQASRPVFNSTYNTTLINFPDEDVNFSFKRGAKFLYSDNQFTDNLSSVLAFYAYYILGLDGDSFALKGGDPYFSKAQNVVMIAQSSMEAGWKSSEKGKRNRFWLIDNARHELFSPLRECFYDYHRKGLDRMYDNQVQARKEIKSALEKLIPISSVRPNSINVLNFTRSKRDEIASIFKDAEKKEQIEVVNTLKRIDPTNSSKYQEILQ